MKISTRTQDEAYNPEAYKYQAYLDGQKLDYCFYADEEGEAHVHVMGADGRVVRNSAMDKAETKIKYGKVELKKMSKFEIHKLDIKIRGGLFSIFKRFIMSNAVLCIILGFVLADFLFIVYDISNA